MKAAATTTTKFCPSCRDRFNQDALYCPNDGTPLLASGAESTVPTGAIVEVFDEAPPAARAPDPYVGREISGHIEIRKLAGVGAMGRVYRAFQKGIDRDVAVKILHRELSANPQLVARFHREAKVASRLQHPNVVHVHLAGQLPDGALYIVMEYLDGLSLQSALAASGGTLSLPRALHVALQLCDAVGEAHAQGIVHRDLKPENVMLVRRGQDPDYVKVLDFGIARLSWGEQSMATAAGLIFGTARYISPEGAQGESVGPPGDVYAIATLLYQMLAGRTPFEGDQAVGILIQQIHDPPPPLKSIARAAPVPDALAEVVMTNLSKDRTERAPDARALGRALLDVARACGISLDDVDGRTSSAAIRLTPNGAFSSAPPAEGSAPSTTRDAGPFGREGSGPDRAEVALALGAKTTKWTPPASVQARMAGAPEPAVPAGLPSSVDATLDDEEPPAPPARTQIATTPEGPAPAFPPSTRPRSSYASIPGGGYVTPEPRAVTSTAPSGVDTTLDDEPAPRRFVRYAALFLLLFLVGGGAAAAVVYQMGYWRPPSASSNLEELLVRANDALAQGRWDAPPGDNVSDLTHEGLKRWPGEPRLVELRIRASDQLMHLAISAKNSGDLHEAVHQSRLATELDPNDGPKRALLHEYETLLAARGATDAQSLLFLVDAGPPAPVSAPPSSTTRPRPPPAPRAALEASPAKPRTGQPVDFAAKVSGSGAEGLSDAHFAVAGPGLGAGAKLVAATEGASYHAGFTFFEPGRYEVTFLAKTQAGAAVRATRAVVVESPKPLPAQGAGTTEPAGPAPSASVKWL